MLSASADTWLVNGVVVDVIKQYDNTKHWYKRLSVKIDGHSHET